MIRASLIGLFALASVTAPLALLGGARPGADGVAIIFAPWTDAGAAIERVARAGGEIARAGGFPFVTIAVASGPDFARRIREEGAWLLLDPQALGGCLDSRPN
ncbi:MAG: hypothetical protein MEP57_01205 [Microvirga sp.]|nr:hypothetical protein [Microvirga sp.]